jgi:CRISPR/Cas system CMR subunit Cmr6 (Cas7 group RAMP superfamily)
MSQIGRRIQQRLSSLDNTVTGHQQEDGMSLELAEEIGKETLNSLKEKFGSSYDSLSDEHKDTLKRVTQRYGKLTAKALVGQVDPLELQATKAALLNLQVAATLELKGILEDTIEEVVVKLGKLARRLIFG